MKDAKKFSLDTDKISVKFNSLNDSFNQSEVKTNIETKDSKQYPKQEQ